MQNLTFAKVVVELTKDVNKLLGEVIASVVAVTESSVNGREVIRVDGMLGPACVAGEPHNGPNKPKILSNVTAVVRCGQSIGRYVREHFEQVRSVGDMRAWERTRSVPTTKGADKREIAADKLCDNGDCKGSTIVIRLFEESTIGKEVPMQYVVNVARCEPTDASQTQTWSCV